MPGQFPAIINIAEAVMSAAAAAKSCTPSRFDVVGSVRVEPAVKGAAAAEALPSFQTSGERASTPHDECANRHYSIKHL